VVYSSVRLGLSPKINALATIIVLLATTGVLTAWWLARRVETQSVNLPTGDS